MTARKNPTMHAARAYALDDVRVEEVPLPELEPGDIRVQVTLCGVCSSDAMDWYVNTKLPVVLGHEPVGTVHEVTPEVEDLEVGDRVFFHHHVPCMECRACQRGVYTSCRRFRETALDPGGFAEFVRVPAEIVRLDVLKLPADLPDEVAAFIEPVACSLRAFAKLDVKPGNSAWVMGAGPMGLINVRLARHFGAEPIIVTDPVPVRRELAIEAGADLALDPASSEFDEEMQEATGDWGAEKVIVGPGSARVIEDGLAHAAPGAVVLIFTPTPPDETVAYRPCDLYFKEVTITHSYSASPIETREALDLLISGAIEVSDLVTHRFGLDGVGEALKLAKQADEGLRSVIYPHGLGVEVKTV
ncbi:MAG: alcohol dehydrogenase catalytic domain-containing protein [Gemmatimonadetes bacterium]|uniref:Alcohol dehydrogenase catalytic domain-containing protein n=1 Tax=Candidatus Kutchimonas denitrificans TaxID=3056748 RepID=A0AAE4ZA00_9BACT|nr:alcohol dehydrogenase catalytic domain-containing protein [Gemmatimonadota bacterium]NIR75417.1 alcohol dehydrogenase catalytic domain-containing protein [Candidatus Kutchimonas denitrificans]NIS01731.1 alcohol dehydrogenase catalytic domain-containing protein [Gemmatimonadota bacterium]NIT67513.1 alcohol dehydrogenase catalytic domain-containing protein [Gemmatimonadota bacterium]NIU53376.1 alcohol dehydrogenase catalytic domain-containing protein [Gemmatimonadota bacterium]